jgi:Tfp pilus assembly protein PilO
MTWLLVLVFAFGVTGWWFYLSAERQVLQLLEGSADQLERQHQTEHLLILATAMINNTDDATREEWVAALRASGRLGGEVSGA